MKVAKNTQNDQKVPNSTQKYRKILKITHKYPKVPKSTKKYSKVHKSMGGPNIFFTGGTTKVAKNTQNDQKVPKSTQKYRKILKITHKYPKVPKSTKKYSKVHKSKGGGSRGEYFFLFPNISFGKSFLFLKFWEEFLYFEVFPYFCSNRFPWLGNCSQVGYFCQVGNFSKVRNSSHGEHFYQVFILLIKRLFQDYKLFPDRIPPGGTPPPDIKPFPDSQIIPSGKLFLQVITFPK